MDRQPSLPVELILDMIEILSAQGERSSAALLAQSCRALRISEPGKRARYMRALASLGITIPERLPANLKYESQVLESSRWPHQEPRHESNDSKGISAADIATFFGDSRSLGSAHEALLRGDKCFMLSEDCKAMQCFVPEQDESPVAAPCLEKWTLQRSIALEAKAIHLSVDADAQFIAIVYERAPRPETENEDGIMTQVIEIRCLRTGARQAKWSVEIEDRDIDSITSLKLTSDYLLIRRTGRTEVGHWTAPVSDDNPALPLIWSSEIYEDAVFVVWLLDPGFLAVQAPAVAFAPADEGDQPTSTVDLWRLQQSEAAKLVAVIEFPEEAASEDFANYVVAGAKLAPGEEGLVVVVALGHVVGLVCSGLDLQVDTTS